MDLHGQKNSLPANTGVPSMYHGSSSSNRMTKYGVKNHSMNRANAAYSLGSTSGIKNHN